jgi:hypothetical protein
MDELKLKALKNLKPGERVEITASSEQIAELQMIYLKISSYQNLFASFMTRTTDKADEFNLKKFLDAYAELTVREYFLLQSIIEPEVGEIGFYMLKCPHNQLSIDIDEHNKTLYIINKAPVKESCDCSEQESEQERRP